MNSIPVLYTLSSNHAFERERERIKEEVNARLKGEKLRLNAEREKLNEREMFSEMRNETSQEYSVLLIWQFYSIKSCHLSQSVSRWHNSHNSKLINHNCFCPKAQRPGSCRVACLCRIASQFTCFPRLEAKVMPLSGTEKWRRKRAKTSLHLSSGDT